MNLLQSAKSYVSKGLSVISTDNIKRSLHPWKQYQSNIATDQQLEQMFSHPKTKGVAIIAGAVSGNLEVIDVDCKYGVNFREYVAAIKKADVLLFDKLMVIETKSKGYHLYYRCEVVEGNQKLANRHATAEEIKDNPNLKEFVLIETRGEGGYVIAPPSEGYTVLQGRNIPLLTLNEREILLSCARSFNQVYDEIKIPSVTEATTYSLKPWEDYNNRADFIELLSRHGWSEVERKGERIYFKRPGATSYTSANYHIGKQVFYVFTTSSQFENKGYSPFAVFALLEHNNDFKEATKKAVEMGYGEKKKIVEKRVVTFVNSLIEQGYTNDDIVDKVMVEYKYSRDEAKSNVVGIIKDSEETIEKFWTVTYNRQDMPKIVISKFKLEQFLSESGFGLYFHDETSNIFRLIKENDGFIEEISTEQVKKFVKDYIMSLPDKFDKKGTQVGISPENLLEIIYKGSDSYFNNSFFEFITHKKPVILRDEHDKCYFAFKNGIVVITEKDVKLVKYGELDKSIWKSQVNFNTSIDIDQDFDPELCEYYRFIKKISGDNENRMNYAMTLIGYILHSYKDPSKPFASILAEETDDESKGGGTGKGIFFHAISKLIPTVRIDGKNFKPDRTFAFQRVTLGTKLVVIEDCPKNVEFERYYPTITEGMTVEKKNKDELFLNYSESPKIAFTTNYSIASNAEHAKRRQRVFEFAPFFNSKNTPMNLFGHKLFDDWDTDEYSRFYNFMFFCVSIYLQNGILEVDNSEKLKRKNIKLSFGEEFLEYMDDLILRNDSVMNFQLSEEWKSFLLRNELEKKDYSLKRFRKAIEISSNTFELNIEWSENRQVNNTKQFKFNNKAF